MDFAALSSLLGIHFATFVVSAVSGFVPLVNTELYLASVSALSSDPPRISIVVVATLGQMVAKSAMYLAGEGVLRLPIKRYEGKIEEYRGSFERAKGRIGALLFLSASTGIPPFYVTPILAGVLRISFPLFFACGFAGRFVRFAAVYLLPGLFKAWF